MCVLHQCLKLALWGGIKSICIFNFYGHCPNTLYRGCANSRYTPMMSDLYPHCWANFPIGANLWVEEGYPISCVYVASVLTQVRLRICVWETHSVFEGNEHAVCLCVLLSFSYWFVGSLHILKIWLDLSSKCAFSLYAPPFNFEVIFFALHIYYFCVVNLVNGSWAFCHI